MTNIIVGSLGPQQKEVGKMFGRSGTDAHLLNMENEDGFLMSQRRMVPSRLNIKLTLAEP